MDNKALYLIAQFDDETQNILAGYYTILKKNGFIGKQTKDIPYHFTLRSYGLEYKTQLINNIEKICSDIPCIDIKLDHIGLFGLDVLFLEPNMNFELLSLQKCFFNDCCNDYHSWTAHATLLIDEPEIILKALPIVVENFKPFKAQIESTALYEFFPAKFIKKCLLKHS